jgi:hypothetical protein
MLRVMGRGFGFIVVVLTMAFGLIYYVKATQAVSPPHGNPKATVEITGVQQDLLAIANAERRYNALNSKYVPLDELISSGELSMERTTRGPYSYTVEVDGDSFIAKAHANDPPQGAPATIAVDALMRVTRD